ncbi:MAG: hypothetical protein GY792_18475, partial [Gammaproteobacteria bacterium]|nr:hypothetical protein [Gammaproteobacteria bacterium]
GGEEMGGEEGCRLPVERCMLQAEGCGGEDSLEVVQAGVLEVDELLREGGNAAGQVGCQPAPGEMPEEFCAHFVVGGNGAPVWKAVFASAAIQHNAESIPGRGAAAEGEIVAVLVQQPVSASDGVGVGGGHG